MSWDERAACKGKPQRWFFPPAGGGRTTACYEMARLLCDVCEVKRECLDYAMRFHDLPGMWGGKTEQERNALRARRRRVA